MKQGRISTGIYGLDDLIGGGFRENTINIIRGGTGVGKTTFALQYLLFALNRGDKIIYVSFELSDEQIIRDCIDMGWYDIEEHIKQGNLKIIHIFGEDITFPSLEITEIVKKSMPGQNLRIGIDPLTYLTFYSENEKRKTLSTIFQELRKLGTAIITLEEPTNDGQIPESSVMPLYLSDTVIHLQNLGFGEMYDRTLKIMKHRGSKHGEGLYPYTIETGLGIVVRPSDKQILDVKPKTKFDEQFQAAIEKTKSMGKTGITLSGRIEVLRKNWTRDEDPTKVLDLIFKEEKKAYGKKT